MSLLDFHYLSDDGVLYVIGASDHPRIVAIRGYSEHDTAPVQEICLPLAVATYVADVLPALCGEMQEALGTGRRGVRLTPDTHADES